MPTVLITGANRGLGLEFARQYAADGWRVIATCRDPEAATALRQVAGDVRIHSLDVTANGSIEALASRLAGEPLDVLVNNAGIIGPKDRFGHTPTAEWLATFHANAIGPVHVAERFADNLARGRLKRIANVTSRMGSIADNSSGGSYAYRSSKAALNMAAKSMAVDLAGRGIIVVVFHPGWVKTDMGGRNAPVEAPDSVAGMRKKIAALTMADSGGFFNYDGASIPW